MSDHLEINLEPSPLRKAIWTIAMVVIVVGTAVLLWHYYQLKQAAILSDGGNPVVAESASAGLEETEKGKDASISGKEEGDEFVARTDTTVILPPPPQSLNDSDPWLREQLPLADPDPHFIHWLGESRDLVRTLVLLANEIAQGKVPRKAFAVWAPEEPFKVKDAGDGQYLLDADGYHRYDTLAEVVEAIDMDLAWRLYQHVRPLVNEAFAEFSPPGARFEDILLQAVEHLLRTPQPHGEIRLVRPSVMYKFADPKLEGLSAAQKQLLRMGPVNATIVKHKLGLLRGLLLQAKG